MGNVLLILLIAILSLIALMLIVALFLKKEYNLHREIIINKPVKEVFDYLKHIKNQDRFSKWVMTDPDMKKTYKGTDGTVGFVYAWDSTNKRAGAGEQEIIQIEEDRKIDIEVRFIRPFAGIAYTPFTTESLTADRTRVVWGIKNKMKYPMNLMVLFMNMEKMLGNDIEISLVNLKAIIEKGLY